MSVASSERETAPLRAPAIRAWSRRVCSRRSFIAILSGLTMFTAFQLGLATVVEIGLPQIRDRVYERRLHLVEKSLRAKNAKPWTVLMMGSSRVQWGFRVGKSEEKDWTEIVGHPVAAFNFGVPGTASLTELLTWNRLRRDGVRPKLLLIEVLPAFLAAPAHDLGEVILPTDRIGWRDLPLIERYAGNTRRGLRRDWLESWPIAGYTHRFGLISLVGRDLLPPTYRQNEGLDESGAPEVLNTPIKPEERRRRTQHAAEEYHSLLAGFQLGGPQCQALRELLASCRKEGVPAAMVVMPEGPTFRSWYPPGTWETIKEWLTQVSREYDAPLVNAHEWLDDEEDFMDSHHLLLSGRNKFKERLERECIFPMLQRAPHQEPYAARLP
jgi:hypothetical protein